MNDIMNFIFTYAEFTLHDFSPDFHSPTGFAKSPTNTQNRRQIGACSHEWKSRGVNYQKHDLRELLTCRRRPWNIWHAKYLDLSVIQNAAVWNEFWLKNTSAMTYSQWESKIQRSRKFGKDLFCVFFYYYYTLLYIFALECSEQVHEEIYIHCRSKVWDQ